MPPFYFLITKKFFLTLMPQPLHSYSIFVVTLDKSNFAGLCWPKQSLRDGIMHHSYLQRGISHDQQAGRLRQGNKMEDGPNHPRKPRPRKKKLIVFGLDMVISKQSVR